MVAKPSRSLFLLAESGFEKKSALWSKEHIFRTRTTAITRILRIEKIGAARAEEANSEVDRIEHKWLERLESERRGGHADHPRERMRRYGLRTRSLGLRVAYHIRRFLADLCLPSLSPYGLKFFISPPLRQSPVAFDIACLTVPLVQFRVDVKSWISLLSLVFCFAVHFLFSIVPSAPPGTFLGRLYPLDGPSRFIPIHALRAAKRAYPKTAYPIIEPYLSQLNVQPMVLSVVAEVLHRDGAGGFTFSSFCCFFRCHKKLLYNRDLKVQGELVVMRTVARGDLVDLRLSDGDLVDHVVHEYVSRFNALGFPINRNGRLAPMLRDFQLQRTPFDPKNLRSIILPGTFASRR
ncbi:hypothetical protein R3P38DRAFT_2764704 [Favolaschia claudopus]|uniref:Ribosomal protein S4 n=1 Tax=Favolaschia claudopus TaxID=2862362 RepID=A0AAW0DC75_9AGAR